jgi:hypothetical protein
VAFAPTLDPACGAADNGLSPRFERSFCMAPCSSNSSCRSQYECIDLSSPQNQNLRHAVVVDLGAGDGGLGFSVCMASTCGDGIKDAAETDVDCGGGTCVSCANKKHCLTGSDCASGTCASGTCVAANCSSNEANNNIGTDADCSGPTCPRCGGPDCAPCTGGHKCTTSSDCTSNICGSNGLCDPGDCANGKLDGAETDVDCGGVVTCDPDAGAPACVRGGCPACATGLKCNQNRDCVSNNCVKNQNNQNNQYCGAPEVCLAPDAGFDGTAPWTPYSPDAGDGDGG